MSADKNPSESKPARLGKGESSLWNRIIPRLWVQEFRRYRRFTRAERAIYLRIRAANEFGAARRQTLLVPHSARSLVFVCFGNIMRSAICEHFFRRSVAQLDPDGKKNFEVLSAGLNAMPGLPAHPWAVSAARTLGVSLDQHRSKLLTPKMVDEADAILAMDYQNMVELYSRYPNAKAKCFLLGTYANADFRTLEIRDPFFADEEQTLDCYRLLERCIQNLAVHLIGEGSPREEAEIKSAISS